VKIDFHADPNPMKAGEDNQFHVTLTDAAGKPISDARVTVTLIMPAMPSMGMPEMKSSCELAWKADSKHTKAKARRRWRARGPCLLRRARTAM
jgi:uncharacterized GH25 family protein